LDFRLSLTISGHHDIREKKNGESYVKHISRTKTKPPRQLLFKLSTFIITSKGPGWFNELGSWIT